MNKRIIDGIEVEISSGNVFADVGLPDADKLKIKSGLVIEITKAVRNLGLSQEEAGRRMGLPQPKLSGLLRGDFSNVSERKLMDCLNRLGYDIEIKVRPGLNEGQRPIFSARKKGAVPHFSLRPVARKSRKKGGQLPIYFP